MIQHDISSLIVVDEGLQRRIPVDVITDRDLVIATLVDENDPDDTAVGDLTKPDLVCAGIEDDLLSTLYRMNSMGVRHIPVIDALGGLAGVLSIDSLLEPIALQMAEIVRLVTRQRTSAG